MMILLERLKKWVTASSIYEFLFKTQTRIDLTKSGLEVEVIYLNRKGKVELEKAEPINLEGLKLGEPETRTVLEIGNSHGVALPWMWLNMVANSRKIEAELLKVGKEHKILLSPPKEEVIAR